MILSEVIYRFFLIVVWIRLPMLEILSNYMGFRKGGIFRLEPLDLLSFETKMRRRPLASLACKIILDARRRSVTINIGFDLF